MQITTFNISLVVHGTVAEDNDFQKVFYGYMWSFTRILGYKVLFFFVDHDTLYCRRRVTPMLYRLAWAFFKYWIVL